MYLYRYFNTGSERLQGAWFSWRFPFDIAYTFVLDDDFYLLSTDFKLYVLNLQPKILNQTITDYSGSTSDLFTATTYDKFGTLYQYDIHLDGAEFITAGTYNSTDNTTNVSWPNYLSYANNSNTDVHHVYAVDATTGEMFKAKSRNGSDYIFHGNFAGNAIIIGISVSAFAELPMFYVRKTSGNKTTSDVTASLIIQRIHYYFNHLGSIGIFSFSPGPTIPGYAIQEVEKQMTPINRYVSDGPVVDSRVTVTVPVYQRNTNIEHLLSSDDPGPCSLTSITWEVITPL